jgi:hypothetical protein
MEDILEVYTRQDDKRKPLVCMDETSKQQIMEVRGGIEMKPGQATKYDTEYKRNGVSNLFMFFAPLEGLREIDVTDQRTKVDWAKAMRELSDKHFPAADKIVVVMDNLNTHEASSFYEAFPPEEARRLIKRFEFHYTPKHGSWLNMAEIELSVLGRQCLSRRIANQEEMRRQTRAWAKERNRKKSKMDWRFTTEDARIRLKRLYPSLAD